MLKNLKGEIAKVEKLFIGKFSNIITNLPPEVTLDDDHYYDLAGALFESRADMRNWLHDKVGINIFKIHDD